MYEELMQKIKQKIEWAGDKKIKTLVLNVKYAQYYSELVVIWNLPILPSLNEDVNIILKKES